MTEVINRLWTMSLQAVILILIILAVRFCLSRYPRIYSYCLWTLVGIKLLCPIWIESSFSLQPDFFTANETIMQAGNTVGASVRQEQNFYTDMTPKMQTQEPSADITPLLPEESEKEPQTNIPAEKNPEEDSSVKSSVQKGTETHGHKLYLLLCAVYCAGIAGITLFYLFQYLYIRKQLSSAVREKGNVWLSDRIASPFVMGVISPKIYLPYNINKTKKVHVLRHERMHIRHCDPLIRIIGTLCLCLHWWNPFVWIGVYFMNQDMEMFCDECVLRHARLEERKAYARTLLSFAKKNAGVGIGLAFVRESHTEKRIRNIMKKRKRSLWIICLLVVLASFCMIALLTVPKAERNTEMPEDTADAEAPDMTGNAAEADSSSVEAEDAAANTNIVNRQVILSEEDLTYLKEICQGVPNFTIEEEMDAAFWKDYLFYTYTSDFDREEVIRYSEQYGFDINYIKVDYTEVDETILQLFGKHLNDYGISPEILAQENSNLIYEDGAFFIAASDSMLYYYVDDTVTQTDILTEVSFIKMFINDEAISQVMLYLLPADNARGFVLDGKEEFHIPAGASGEIIEGQSYDVEMNPYGSVTFAVYAPDLSISPYADATYKLLQNGEAIYRFPRKGTGVREDQSVFDGIAAVAFPDLNGDGYTDVVTISYYEHESGPVPSQARIFTYHTDGYFLEEVYLEAAFNESHETKTIAEIEAFAAQPENQDYFIHFLPAEYHTAPEPATVLRQSSV